MGFFLAEKSLDKHRKSAGGLSVQSVKTLNARGCSACPMNGLEKTLRNPKMPASGAARPTVYVLGEAPGEDEDWAGVQFIGAAGKILRKALEDADRGYKTFTRFNNVIRCHPPKNRDPSLAETECCRGYVVADIEQSKPKVIIGTGNIPLQWFLSGTPAGAAGISKLAFTGLKFPVKVGKHVCWYFPVMHPAYVRRVMGKGKQNELESVLIGFNRSVERAVSFANGRGYVPPSYVDSGFLDGVEYLFGNRHGDVAKVEGWLHRFSKKPMVALDIETTGLRPYAKSGAEDKRILTIGLSDGELSVAFPVNHPLTSKDYRVAVDKLLRRFLYETKNVRKLAQNAQFELEWFANFYGKNVVWSSGKWEDTLAQAYTLRETSRIHSLGMITLRCFGFNLKALSPNMNMEKMQDEPLEKVLPYNALDAKYEYLVYLEQKRELDLPENKALAYTYRYQCEMAGTLALAQAEGMDVDRTELKTQSDRLGKEIEEVMVQIKADPAAVAFKKRFGADFIPTSNKDLPRLFRDVLGRSEGVTEDRESGKTGYTTEEAMLTKIEGEVPMASLILRLRKASKLKSTYLDATETGMSSKGRLHTWYNNSLTSTGRLSSESPNNQNYPSRKDKWIRKIIVAKTGCVVASFDYGQIDARNIAMASRDDFFCRALWDGYDIHQHWTERAVKEYPQVLDAVIKEYDKKDADEADLIKTYRKHMKNSFTFPIFYGSTADQIAAPCFLPNRIARGLWEEFWETMPGVLEWQRGLVKFYKRHGYVETLNGRRRHEPMSKNEILNSPIQGTTAEVVGNAMIRLSRMAYPEVQFHYQRKTRRSLQPYMQIHDDLTNNVRETRLDERILEIAKVMVDVPFDWVCVPIAVEVKAGPNWCDQKDIGVFSSDELLGKKRPDWLRS